MLTNARELKRVPLDFDWPINKVWDGYQTQEPTEPPQGDGFQMWETTTEGSPQSPVFDTLDALCEWCAENATTFASVRATADQWKVLLTNTGASQNLLSGAVEVTE